MLAYNSIAASLGSKLGLLAVGLTVATSCGTAMPTEGQPSPVSTISGQVATTANKTESAEPETTWVTPTEQQLCFFDPFAPRSTTSCGESLPSGASTFDAPLGLGYEKVSRESLLTRENNQPPVPLPTFLSDSAVLFGDGAPDGRLIAISDEDEAFGRWFAILHFDSPNGTIDEAISQIDDGREVQAFRIGEVEAYSVDQDYAFLDFRGLEGWDVTVVFDGHRTQESMKAFVLGFIDAAQR